MDSSAPVTPWKRAAVIRSEAGKGRPSILALDNPQPGNGLFRFLWPDSTVFLTVHVRRMPSSPC